MSLFHKLSHINYKGKCQLQYLSIALALVLSNRIFSIIVFFHMHCKRFVTRRCKWLGLTWRYWRWWLTKLLLKLLHTWHIWASNRYEAHSSDCKQTEHPQKEQNIELSPKTLLLQVSFKIWFHAESIFIKNECSRSVNRCIYTTYYLVTFMVPCFIQCCFHYLHDKCPLCH